MKVDGREIEISHPDKVLFPESGITKKDLVDYYVKIAEHMLPFIHDRPLVMRRFPDGLEGEGFYQKEVPEYFPDWISTVEVELKKGGTQQLVVADNAATLAYLANQACLTPHVWLSTVDSLNEPDRMIFDMDPPGEDWELVKQSSFMLRELLKDKGYDPLVMTTGSKGLHVVVPLDEKRGFDAVREEAQQIAQSMEDEDSEKFTTSASKSDRKKTLYVDTARNAYGQTGVAPYSLRARPGAPIATPVEWDEVSNIGGPRHYHIGNIFQRLSKKKDIWR